jgi:tagatose 6-phosphate kinase
MILTVTLNTALDVTYRVPRLAPNSVNRVESVHQRAGGKGVNVARVLRTVGQDALVTGFAGGPTGAALRADLDAAGVPHDLVAINGDTRRTVTVVSDSGTTVLNEPGPSIADAEWTDFLATYSKLAQDADIVVLSGSLPPGLPRDAYAQLITKAGVPTILDTAGDPLLAALPARPHLIKPNIDELIDATKLTDPFDAAAALRAAGAQTVVASLGPAGLLAVTGDGTWRAAPPQALPGNPTGAGDACVAALAAGLMAGTPWPVLVREAVALSAAAVLSSVAGDVDIRTFGRLLEGMHAHADR